MKTATWFVGLSLVVLLAILLFGAYVPALVQPDEARDSNGYTKAQYDEAYRDIGYNFTKSVTLFEDKCRENGDQLVSVTYYFGPDGDIVGGDGECSGVGSLEAMATP